MKRFASKEEMQPLLDLCRQGKLFEVQELIRQGSPVNPPLFISKKPRIKGPLEYAVHLGFYSLVQILLEAGANVVEANTNSPKSFRAIYHAVEDQRMDLIELLVKYGADVRDVQWETILHTWRSDIIHYCIEHGADLEDADNPVAYAFECKIRPMLGVYKTYEKQLPGLKRQINIALRYHTAAQNRKWVSLLLWAGADPYAIGPEDYQEYKNYDNNALGIALYDGWEWMLEQIKKPTPSAENSRTLLKSAWRGKIPKNVEWLIDSGCIQVMPHADQSDLVAEIMRSEAYCSHARESGLVILDLILSAGARWDPDPESLKDTRRWMLRGKPVGFQSVVKLLEKHKTCAKEVLHELTRTGTAQRLLLAK